MKKAITVSLVIVTVLAILITGIFYVRRNIPDGGIMILQNQTVTESTSASASAQTQPSETAKHDSQGLININTATVDELATLPGIGTVLAQRIVDYRQVHGNFKKLTDLMKVNGIGSTKLERILDLITLGG